MGIKTRKYSSGKVEEMEEYLIVYRLAMYSCVNSIDKEQYAILILLK